MLSGRSSALPLQWVRSYVLLVSRPGEPAARSARRDQGEGLMGRERDFAHIPIIDVTELDAGGPARRTVAAARGGACRESGFFYVVGHGVDAALQGRLSASAGSSLHRTWRRSSRSAWTWGAGPGGATSASATS